MANRLMLAPLTNLQSHADGTLSDEEANWLTMRARGGFGLTMTAAAHVQRQGQGFPGQLGVWSDDHLPGLTRLAGAIRAAGSLSAVQLHHAGNRSPRELTGADAVCPWDDAETGARALTTGEIEQVIEDFILAGLRAEKAGFDGIELHGAHGYLLAAFLDTRNRRQDEYGGSLANRRRAIDAIIAGLRQRAGPQFQIGLRISPERFGIDTGEALELAGSLMASGQLDYLDMSLWDCFKTPEDAAYSGKPLIEWFIALHRGDTRLGVAGKIMSGEDVRRCLDAGADFVLLGRAAILHHDFPQRLAADGDFASVPRPVSRDYLAGEGVQGAFLAYLETWPDFVARTDQAGS